MDHAELLALKLQMGISPSTQIEPNILRAMWQQLKIESAKVRATQSDIAPHPDSVTYHSIFV
jgi:hypothetical protein